MRKAAYQRNRDRVRALNAQWTYALGFRSWRHFEIRYYARRRDLPKRHRSRAGWDTVMWTTVRWEYLDAVIHVNLPAVARETDESLEHIWLHELSHVLVNEMRPTAGSTDADYKHEELVCTRLAMAFRGAYELGHLDRSLPPRRYVPWPQGEAGEENAVAQKKNPVGRPRTVNKDLPAGLTRSGDPPRVRVSGSAAGKRDDYKYRADAEKQLGRKLTYSEVVDHLNPDTKAEVSPKTRVITRSENSKKDAGLRKGPDGKMRPSKGKK